MDHTENGPKPDTLEHSRVRAVRTVVIHSTGEHPSLKGIPTKDTVFKRQPVKSHQSHTQKNCLYTDSS